MDESELCEPLAAATADRKARMMELIQAFEGSTSLQVGAIMGLFEDDNVDDLIAAMPEDFRPDFVDWCSRMHAGGEPLRAWEPAFERGFDAVRGWLERKER